MIYRAYNFSSEAAAQAGIAATSLTAWLAIDVIGVAYAETAEGVEPVALPGWYVNAAWLDAEPAAWAAARIDAAEAPRWWSGVPRVEAVPAPPAVPATITPLQARRALRAAGLHAAVAAHMAGQPEEAQEAWEYCVEVRRDDPMILNAQVALGITGAQMDTLFRAAAELLV